MLRVTTAPFMVTPVMVTGTPFDVTVNAEAGAAGGLKLVLYVSKTALPLGSTEVLSNSGPW